MMKITLIGLATALWALACQGQFYMEAGPWWRGDMKVSVQGGSRAAESGLHAGRSGISGSLPAAQSSLLRDDGAAQIIRQFDDGYVGPSGWAWAQEAESSQYFGYSAAAQYDPNAQTLSFNRTLETSASSIRTETRITQGPSGWSGRDRANGAGVQATVGYLLDNDGNWRWGAQLIVGWMDGISGGFHNRETYSEQVSVRTRQAELAQREVWRYRYDTLGNPAFPAAPYAMGDPNGVGPMIAATPESIVRTEQELTSSESFSGWSSQRAVSRVDLDVNASAWVFQAGPRLMWQAAPRLALLVQPAVTVTMLTIEGNRTETFRWADGSVVGEWRDRADKQTSRLGAGIQTGVQLALTECWYVTAAGGYHWVDEAQCNVGPDRVTIALSGYDFSAAVGFRF